MGFGIDAGLLASACRNGVHCDAFLASSTADWNESSITSLGRRLVGCCSDDCMHAVGWRASAKLKHKDTPLDADWPHDRLSTPFHCFCV